MKKWKQRLLSNMFMRNMLSDIFGRYTLTKTRGGFTAYAQYKIGQPQNDHYLYFKRLPFPHQYHKAFIKKLLQYNREHISDFLQFHYDAYGDKGQYLQGIKYTLLCEQGKIREVGGNIKLLSAYGWVQRQLVVAEMKRWLSYELIWLLQPFKADRAMEEEARILPYTWEGK